MRVHRIILTLLYSITICSIILIVRSGWEYYQLPLIQRPRHLLHESWKASGFIGHGLGIVGTVLIISLLFYPARKYFRFMHSWGNIRVWLNYHIWMGVTAPLLITFHSTFKFDGLVGWSYWSMVAVAVSGILGRYLYLQIPRTLSGDELTVSELARIDKDLCDQIQTTSGLDEEVLCKLRKAEGDANVAGQGLMRSNLYWLIHDLLLPLYLIEVRRTLASATGLSRPEIRKLMKLARRRSLLHRKRTFLNNTQRMFRYWHLIHRPFALIMFVIMVVHITVTVLFGYWWIFKFSEHS